LANFKATRFCRMEGFDDGSDAAGGVIFHSIPESAILLSLVVAILGLRWKAHLIFPAAVLSALASWGVRALPLPYGLHTLIGLLVFILLFVAFFRISFLRSLFGSLFALGSLIALQVLIIPIVARAAGITDLRDIWADSWLRIFLAWPELVLMGLVAWLLYRFRPFPERINRTEAGERRNA